jgi:non-ribosomal peptide synthetase component E (peptide arylation enzyme)
LRLRTPKFRNCSGSIVCFAHLCHSFLCSNPNIEAGVAFSKITLENPTVYVFEYLFHYLKKPIMLNLATLLEDSVFNYPDKPAVICGDARLTYAELNEQANQVANALKEFGVEKGDKVSLSCPNLPHFPIVCFGILKTGAVVVALNILFEGRRYEVSDLLPESAGDRYVAV